MPRGRGSLPSFWCLGRGEPMEADDLVENGDIYGDIWRKPRVMEM